MKIAICLNIVVHAARVECVCKLLFHIPTLATPMKLARFWSFNGPFHFNFHWTQPTYIQNAIELFSTSMCKNVLECYLFNNKKKGQVRFQFLIDTLFFGRIVFLLNFCWIYELSEVKLYQWFVLTMTFFLNGDSNFFIWLRLSLWEWRNGKNGLKRKKNSFSNLQVVMFG